MAGFLDSQLSESTSMFGLKLWVVVCLCVGAFILLMLLLLSLWLTSRRKPRRSPSIVIPMESKEIKEVSVAPLPSGKLAPPHSRAHSSCASSDAEMERKRAHQSLPPREIDVENGSVSPTERQTLWKMVGEERNAHNAVENGESRSLSGLRAYDKTSNVSGGSHSSEFNPSPAYTSYVPEVSHLGWGHWYTLRDLELATNFFAASNVLGEGGYGMVYRGELPDGSFIAVKNLLNNRGQAEKEFRVEVEAIGRVRHKNLVRLIGYCAEGSHRMLVYEFVDNGNLDQWLHGSLGENQTIPWEDRMKIMIGTAKGLAYLHEGLEPKVVHRDIKSSNILLDTQWNAKVSDFGLAKLLGAGKSFVTTRVMGTFGYVAPEYANTGLLNERSDVYSFGVLLMEIITGRDPVDYSRSTGEVNLVDWLKTMVGNRRSEELVDPRLEVRPSSRVLKRALLVALRCVDPDAQKRPKMGHVVHMLEADEYPYNDDRRSARTKSSPRHQASLGKEAAKGSPSYRQIKGSPAHRGGILNEENLELVLDSPSGPGYKPSLRRMGT